MKTSDFDFHLPPERVAQEPVPRGTSRLMVLGAEPEAATRVEHRSISDLPTLLRAGDLLVVNDTRVLPARLFARRLPSGGKCEVLLIEKLSPRRWLALARPAKRLRLGGTLRFVSTFDEQIAGSNSVLDGSGLAARVLAKAEGGRVDIEFSEPVEPHLESLGHVPLPPYIQRPDTGDDRDTYQTVFARHAGAVAAPTAGLHFNDALLERLDAAGVERASVTLHVGIGTFRPVSVDDVADHRMDEERYTVPPETADAVARLRERGGRLVAVGTTVVRTLESVMRDRGTLEACSGRTDIFITPGYRFRAVDVLLTNFHLPQSTLLMLVSAFAGRARVLDAYQQAIDEGYRFYSYGDAMLLERRTD